MIPDVPPTPLEEVESISLMVDALVGQGKLVDGECAALYASLEAVTTQLNSGNTVPACNIIQAFMNKVEAKIKSGKLSLAEGQPLIDAAQYVSFCR